MSSYSYSWWVVPVFSVLLAALIVSIPAAFITRDWRYLTISIVCFAALRQWR